MNKPMMALLILISLLLWWQWPQPGPGTDRQPSDAGSTRHNAPTNSDTTVQATQLSDDGEAEPLAMPSVDTPSTQGEQMLAAAHARLEQAWENWHQLVNTVADTMGGLTLSRSSLFSSLVARLPEELLASEHAREIHVIDQRVARLRVLHKALEVFYTQWQSMRAAREALEEQRKLWSHLAERHQFGLSAIQRQAIHDAQIRIAQYRQDENFPAATQAYQQLRAIYEIDEVPINRMLDARRAALAAQTDWQALESEIGGHGLDESAVEKTFAQAQIAALSGHYEKAMDAYLLAGPAWQALYRQGLVVRATPTMVAIPAGSFLMGDRQGIGQGDEQPIMKQTLPAFRISKTEVTFAHFDAYLMHQGLPLNDDMGWGRGARPVVNVSWSEARAYAQWLGEQTGRAFGLPTEAQWEYVARAGSGNAYGTGSDLTNQAHCEGCNGWGQTRSLPVAHFAANAFGVHDMHGNVWEWVADCYRPRYGMAIAVGDVCTERVIRGGGWADMPPALRAANRSPMPPEQRSGELGFRLVELLSAG